MSLKGVLQPQHGTFQLTPPDGLPIPPPGEPLVNVRLSAIAPPIPPPVVLNPKILAGNVNVPFGKLSFDVDRLAENAKSVIATVLAAKPHAVKGIYVNKCTVSSTMGPGLPLENRELSA
jgi:hypothetical protein